MNKIRRFFSTHFNWDEMCEDEETRIRSNSTIFFTAIAFAFFIMAVLNIITMTINLLIVTGVLCVVFSFLSFLVIKHPHLYKNLAYIAGIIAFLMSAYFVYSGGTEGFSVIWLCVFPTISYLIFCRNVSSAFIVSICMLVYICFLTPVYDLLGYEYTSAFRFRFPVVMTFSAICSSLGELIRYHTQRRLKIISQSLRDSMNIDTLTGIGNRNAFNELIKMKSNELSALAYAIIDVDFFKKVNDTYGHDVGDIVLKALGQLLSQNIRSVDYVYRWGGEEFLIVSPEIKFDDFKQLIERLCLLVENYHFVVNEDLTLRITISAGGIVGCVDPEFNVCFKMADECMYEAKNSGRNRAVIREVYHH